MNAQLQPIFPEPIVLYSGLGVDQEKLHKLYDQQEWISTNGEDNADYFLKISKNLKVLNSDETLKNVFIKAVNDYSSRFMLYKNKFCMTTSWFTKTEKNRISVLHNHDNAMFCAVYYFGASDGIKSRIVFEKPVTSQFDLKPSNYNVLNGPSHVFEMENDSLLIFPSYLKHKVARHENNEVRKSLAINFIPTGVLGAGTTEVLFDGTYS